MLGLAWVAELDEIEELDTVLRHEATRGIAESTDAAGTPVDWYSSIADAEPRAISQAKEGEWRERDWWCWFAVW